MVEITANKYTRVITLNQSCNVQFALQPLSQTATGRIEIQARRFKNGVFVGNLDRSNRILYGLFDNIAVEAIHVLEGETLQLWGIYRGIPPFEAVILNASIVNLEVTEPEPEEEEVGRILHRDAETWGTQWHYGNIVWNSAVFGQDKTGSIVFGFVKLSRLLHLAIGGHGNTDESFLDILATDDTELYTYSVGSLIMIATNNAQATSDSPLRIQINTSTHNGETAKIQVRDAHSGGNGWASVNFATLLVED